MNRHSVIAILHLGWLILSYLPDSLLGLSPLNYFGITLEFAGPVFPRSTLLKTTDIQFFATYGLCTFAIIGFAHHFFSKINVVENNGYSVYPQPDIRQIRTCVSAKSFSFRMSGLKCWAHLLQQCTYPTSLHRYSRIRSVPPEFSYFSAL